MDSAKVQKLVDGVWDESIVSAISEYIRIPNKSPAFDKDWEAAGHMERAISLIEAWCRAQAIDGLKLEVVRLPGRTPVLFFELAANDGSTDDTVLLYGHYDKQPEMTGWGEGLSPWTPVMREGKLYGRGGADDGYATFASLLAIRAVRELGGKHKRCVGLIEGCEESGSFDLPHYIEHLRTRIGSPSLIVCLDSGAGNYEQLWVTTSLRGLIGGKLTVRVLEQGVHSGDASGIVPDSFRLARQILSRLEDPDTGRVLPKDFYTEVPEARREQAHKSSKVLGESLFARFPYAGSTQAMSEDLTELVLNRTWRPYLTITGAGGLPPIENAGNVLRPETSLKVSLRIPPQVSGKVAQAALTELLTKDPPNGASVTFHSEEPGDGWNAPALAPWLENALEKASQTYYAQPSCFMGEGGTIPFMGMLGREFPEAQFVITGVLGPQSNAHGPDEFLHVPYAKKLTACIAQLLDEHARR